MEVYRNLSDADVQALVTYLRSQPTVENPKPTRTRRQPGIGGGSMQVALHDLALEHLWVVYSGGPEYALDERIIALPVDALPPLATALC